MRYIVPSNRPSKLCFVLGAIAVLYSANLLYVVVPQWFEATNHDGPLDWIFEWLTHISYLVPKLGVMIGLLSLFRFPRYSFYIYGICWLFGILHSILYYIPQYSRVGSFAAMNFISGEWEVVNHGIPHLFYPTMLFLLRRTRNLQE